MCNSRQACYHHAEGCIYLRTNLNYRIRDDLNNDDLECLIVEISKPRSSAFLVGTWYRPPNSQPERFNEFEIVIDKIDAENKELFILGDVNCNCCQRLMLIIPLI